MCAQNAVNTLTIYPPADSKCGHVEGLLWAVSKHPRSTICIFLIRNQSPTALLDMHYLTSYLRNRKQYVAMSKYESVLAIVNNGVPPGSVL